jgi:thiamine-phosphate pyrophosphorylase
VNRRDRRRSRTPLPSPLYAIADPAASGVRPVETLVGDVLSGGGRLVQLRMKEAATGPFLALAESLRERTRRAGGLLIVNDRPDIALAVGADGVHLGAEDLPVAAARRLLGPDALIGYSTHSVAEAIDVAAGGLVDYVAFGPVFPTGTKDMPHAPLGLERLREARRRVRLPLVAIGGITADTAPAVRAAGADAVAMIGALARAPDVAALVRRILADLSR